MIVGLLKYNLKQRDTTHEALEAGAQTLAASSPVPEASTSEPSLSAAASPGGLFTGPRNIWCHDPDHLNAPNQPALIVSSFNMKKKTSQSETEEMRMHLFEKRIFFIYIQPPYPQNGDKYMFFNPSLNN